MLRSLPLTRVILRNNSGEALDVAPNSLWEATGEVNVTE